MPHEAESSPDIYGRIVDADSGMPVGGATVSLIEAPEIMTVTDTDGSFHLQSSHYIVWYFFPPHSGFTDYSHKSYVTLLMVAHPAYDQEVVSGWNYRKKSDAELMTGDFHLDDIALKGKGR